MVYIGAMSRSIYAFGVVAFASLVVSCQTFPRGDRLENLATELSDRPPAVELLSYVHMGMSAWREFDSWQDTGWELDHFRHDPTNTMGVAIRFDDTLHFAFRGTQAPENAIDRKLNFQFRAVRIPFVDDRSMKAHRGILSKYLGVRDAVHARVRATDAKKIKLVGHSAGGAVAVLALLDLVQTYPDRSFRVVTFGSPRVLNRPAARALDPHNDRIVRVVAGRDIIPNVPPAVFNFRHVGRLVRIGDRPIFRLFAAEDHWPAYRDVLRELAAEHGHDKKALGFW